MRARLMISDGVWAAMAIIAQEVYDKMDVRSTNFGHISTGSRIILVRCDPSPQLHHKTSWLGSKVSLRYYITKKQLASPCFERASPSDLQRPKISLGPSEGNDER